MSSARQFRPSLGEFKGGGGMRFGVEFGEWVIGLILEIYATLELWQLLTSIRDWSFGNLPYRR